MMLERSTAPDGGPAVGPLSARARRLLRPAAPVLRPALRVAGLVLPPLVKLAAVAGFTAAAVWLLLGHVTADTLIRFSRFYALDLVLPGLVIWRVCTRRRRNLLEDVAAGTMVGIAGLTLAYLMCGWLNQKPRAWLWAVPVVLVALAVPRFRRRVLRRVTEPLSPLGAWLAALSCMAPLYALTRYRDGLMPKPYTDARWHSPDMAFHQALAASAKYDFPVQASWVHGEPMAYHTFFHEFTAAVAWATGVDLTDLIFEIGWVPIMLAGTALMIPLAQRITRNAVWTGPLAVMVATLGGTVQAYLGNVLPPDHTTSYIWTSPTQNLGGGLTVLLALIGVDLLRKDGGRLTWVMFTMVAMAAAGSKATVLPVIVCGFGLAALFRLLSRRMPWPALAGAVIGSALFGLIVAIVFAGQSSGLAVRPWRVFRRVAFYWLVNFRPPPEVDHRALWVTGVVCCLAWTLGAAGLLVALVPARRWLRDQAVPYLLGIAIGGFSGMLLTDQSGNSQLYFHRTAVPVIAVLASFGLWRLVVRFRDRFGGVVVALAVVAGAAAAAIARPIIRDRDDPSIGFRTPDGHLTGLVEPWLWITGLALAGALVITVLWKVARRRGNPFLVLPAAFLAACMGAGLLVPVQALAHTKAWTFSSPGLDRPVGPTATKTEAAHWLRDHSAPGDLVATNAHCVIHLGRNCDDRHFWIAALTERHVLVEGWGYTNKINAEVAGTDESPFRLPFWDQQRLDDNDAAFKGQVKRDDLLRKPPYELKAALNLLKKQYGVRWLYFDLTYSPRPDDLRGLANLRYETVDAEVYELR